MVTARSRETQLRISRETRERFVTATEGVIAETGRAILERVTSLSDQIGNAREMQMHRDDFFAFRGQQANWVERTQAAWRKAVASSKETGGSLNSQSRLELMGDEVVENNILSSRLSLQIQEKAEFDLNDLRLRIQYLDDVRELGPRDVLRPETISRLLVDQWVAAGLARDLWTRAQDVISRHVVAGLAKGYKEANAYLIAQGVMPEIDLKNFVKRAPGMAASDRMDLGASFVGAPATGSASVPGRLAARNIPTVGIGAPPGSFAPAAIGVVGGGAAGDFHGAGGSGGSPLLAARQRAQGVLLNLKRFVSARIGGELGQRGGFVSGGAGQGGGGGMVVAPAFAAAIADAGAAYQIAASQYLMAADEATAVHQVHADLRRRTNELKRKAPTTADKATVEIVALMFQAILAEERIPFSARVWFARLQMPVLRVAIAEPEFFGTLQHPARMLIDRMGSVAMGFDAAAISGSALEGEIRRVVQVIEQYPETGQRVFKLVYDEFVAFLSKYLTQSDATQRVMSVAQQVEQKETMAIQYTIELRKMLNDMPVREEIREFLFKVWAEVLAIAALKFGGQHEQTQVLKRAASDLVWAASAKPNRNDRARVIQDLPKLLQRLRQGMEMLGVTGDPQEEHIKIIGKTLSDAFMSKTESIPAAQIEAMAGRLANLEDFFSDEGGAADLPLDAASIELLLGVDAASIEVVPDSGTKVAEDMLAWAHELQVGNWFMIDHNNRASQIQYVWRSDRKHLHLFASSDGRKFLIQVGRLASYLQAGLLVPAEEETLTVRATREALAKLDANPERLLN